MTIGVRNSGSEEDLVRRVVRQDPAAIKALYGRYVGYLTAVCGRYIADDEEVKDILQDSFIKIFRSMDRFTYRGEGSLKAWMRQISVNEALKKIRKRKSRNTLEYKWDLPDLEEEEEPDVGNIPSQVIQEMIRELPEGYRTVLNLYAFEEKSHREISELLGISESTSASQLHRARSLLAKKLDEYKKKTEQR